MTDGVAMLTRAKENLIFTMSALSEVQRIALSHSKREFIEMCSFNGKECDIGMIISSNRLLCKLNGQCAMLHEKNWQFKHNY